MARDSLNPQLSLLGVLLNLADMRTLHSRCGPGNGSRERFGEHVFQTAIRASIAYAESVRTRAVDHRLPPRPRGGTTCARPRRCSSGCPSEASPATPHTRARVGRRRRWPKQAGRHNRASARPVDLEGHCRADRAGGSAKANRLDIEGRVAQWESARLPRERSQVRNPPRPFSKRRAGASREAPFRANEVAGSERVEMASYERSERSILRSRHCRCTSRAMTAGRVPVNAHGGCHASHRRP